MEITVSEFRKDVKKYFDLSLAGEVVCIDRGGIHFNLTARIPKLDDFSSEHASGLKWPNPNTQATEKQIRERPPVVEASQWRNDAEAVKALAQLPDAPTSPLKEDFAVCKNGHPIPPGRNRCLGKGCKYSK